MNKEKREKLFIWFLIISVVSIVPLLLFSGFAMRAFRSTYKFAGNISNITTIKSEKISNRSAKKLLVDFIPVSAKDIHYEVRPYHTSLEAEFSINENDFQDWIRHKQMTWNLEREGDDAGTSRQNGNAKGINPAVNPFIYRYKGNNYPYTAKIRIHYEKEDQLCSIKYSCGTW